MQSQNSIEAVDKEPFEPALERQSSWFSEHRYQSAEFGSHSWAMFILEWSRKGKPGILLKNAV